MVDWRNTWIYCAIFIIILINEYDNKGYLIHYKNSHNYHEWYERYKIENLTLVYEKCSDGHEIWYEYHPNGNLKQKLMWEASM